METSEKLKTLKWDIDQSNSKTLSKTGPPLESMLDEPKKQSNQAKGKINMIRPPDPKRDKILNKVGEEGKKSSDAARERAKAKLQEIRKLRKENQSLKAKVIQHDQKMHAAMTEIKVRDKKIKEFEEMNKKLENQLDEESANLKFYKQRVRNFDTDTQKYRDRIKELITLKKEETDVRQKLENELKTTSQEIMSLREQKLEAESREQNTQKKLEIRIEMCESLKEKFEEERADLKIEIQTENQKFKKSLQQAEKLALDVVRLSKENMCLEKELTKQDETIQGIFAESQTQQQAIKLLQHENRDLRKELTANTDEKERLETELADANDRLKKMAERVYYLVNRLTDLEEYKRESDRKMRVSAKELEETQHRIKQLQLQIQQEQEAKLKVLDEVKALRQSTVEFRKSATDYENKFRKTIKSNKKMQELLQAKTLKLRELLASSEVRMRKTKDDSSQRNMYASLQKKIDELISSSEFLKKKVHHLERVNSKYQYRLRKKDTEIKELKKHNRLVTAFSTKQTTKSKSKNTNGKTSAFNYSEAHELLQGEFGNELDEFLQYYSFDEITFFQIMHNPLQLLAHFVNRHKHVVPSIFTDRNDPPNRRIKQLERNNSKLSSRVHLCEDAKIKSIMRLAAVLANTPNKRSQLPTTLSLTANLLGDVECECLAEALQNCEHIHKIDFRDNSIADKGLMALIGAALVNDSITHIILRNNRVTLRGLQKLFATLEEYGSDPPAFEKMDSKKVPIMLITVQERELTVDLRENSFDPEMLKEVEKGLSKEIEMENEVSVSKRFEKWLLSQTSCSKIGDGKKPSSSQKRKKIKKSASTPAIRRSRPSSGKSSGRARLRDDIPLRERLKKSALKSSSKIGRT